MTNRSFGQKDRTATTRSNFVYIAETPHTCLKIAIEEEHLEISRSSVTACNRFIIDLLQPDINNPHHVHVLDHVFESTIVESNLELVMPTLQIKISLMITL